ncbi:unnamed protein product [Vicia faba]|uniref:Reverse transcriptase Ty1/copia-type domain-containing protein n=1 Tax=Vicia faba TaxID=3906 RepID=A0AAV1AY60_VICFA|nr:unnamed protein product [Vicia faba]
MEDAIVKDNGILMMIQIYVDDILVTEFPTQRKDELVALINYEVNRKLVQTSDFETNDEENVMDIVHTIRIKFYGMCSCYVVLVPIWAGFFSYLV